MKRINSLLKVYGNHRDTNFDYEGGEIDESRELYGEEFEHAENCEFIYGNCNCGLENEGHEDIWEQTNKQPIFAECSKPV